MKVEKIIAAILVILSTLTACTHLGEGNDFKTMNKERKTVEDSILIGKMDFAQKVIDEKLKTAKDSDSYYLWLSTKNRENFYLSDAKAMEEVNIRICRYLAKNGKNTESRKWVEAEYYMAKSVFFITFLWAPDSALEYNTKALKKIDAIEGTEDHKLLTLLNRGYILRTMGRYDESADMYYTAQLYSDSINANPNNLVAIKLGVASVYNTMRDLENAKVWWKEVEKNLPKMSEKDKFIYYNDHGNYHYFSEEYEEAKKNFEQAVALTKGKVGKEWDYYTALGNLAEIYIILGQNDAAENALNKVETFGKKVNHPTILYYVDSERIKLELQRGNNAKAMEIYRNSENEKEVDITQQLIRMKALKELFEKTGHYKDAYFIQDRIEHIDDSINSANIKMRMSANILRYRHDKRLLQQQQEIKRKELTAIIGWTFAVIAVLAAGIIALIVVTRIRRQKINVLTMRQQLRSLKMEAVRNRINPHFIFNALNHEMLCQLKGKEVDFTPLITLLRRGLEQADKSVTTLADELKFIDFYVKVEGQKMGGKLMYEKKIDADVDINSIKIPAMTIQIFVENAIKHGLQPIAKVREPQLTVLAKRKDNGVRISVLDNGEGITAEAFNTKSTGIRTIRQTIQLFNDRNSRLMTFGTENRTDGCSGVDAWIFIPDNYKFDI